jgi:beta-fructofuranosidase
MNDPNGTIYFNGEYHLFYHTILILKKRVRCIGAMLKSKDMVHWEHLPIAITPSEEKEKWNVGLVVV